MKKVVIFNGSPRYDGNTATILQMIERGAKEHHADVKNYFLFKMKMSACMGCFGCQANNGKCSISDELTKAIEEVKKADMVVVGSPIYFCQMNGMTKNLYDRFFPLMGEEGAPRYGMKKLVTVYTQGMQDAEMNKDYLDFVAGMNYASFGLQEIHRIVCPGANNPETAEKNMDLKREAYEVGRKLATGE